MNTPNKLLSRVQIGDLDFRNRIVMASMTRGRVKNEKLVPGDQQALYYGQRASAGLIMSEGTWVNEQAIGFANVPGIYTADQVEGWKKVTDAVHRRGGKIFCQLGHTGSLSHPEFQGGGLPIGPSAINIQMQAFTANGLVDTVTPRAMTLAEIHQTVQDYKKAAQNAIKAGFDGVEIHAQHPSLLSQFFSETLNRREDAYGGTVENRTRILFEILGALSELDGLRVGVKLNPNLNYGRPGEPDDLETTYRHILQRLNDFDISFVQILNRLEPGMTEEDFDKGEVFDRYAGVFKGTVIANGHLDFEKASQLIDSGKADLVAFGKLYISNPDLPERLATGRGFNDPDPDTFFMGDEKGYIDYPDLNAVS